MEQINEVKINEPGSPHNPVLKNLVKYYELLEKEHDQLITERKKINEQIQTRIGSQRQAN